MPCHGSVAVSCLGFHSPTWCSVFFSLKTHLNNARFYDQTFSACKYVTDKLTDLYFFPSFIFCKCHFFFFFVLIILCKHRFGRNGRRIYVKEKGAIASLKVFKIFILISFSGLNLLSFSGHLSFVFWVFFLCTVEKIFHNLAKLKKSLYITSITSKSCMITCTRLGINYLFKLQTIECCENNKSCSSRRQCMQVFFVVYMLHARVACCVFCFFFLLC